MAINDYLRTSSADIEGNLNFRRITQRKLYSDWIIGSGDRRLLGHETHNSNGSPIDNSSSRPPSWTQNDAGINHSNVIFALSSSDHYEINLNSFRSGSLILENTHVSGAVKQFYNKNNRFVQKIYKLTASTETVDSTRGNEFFRAVSGSYFVIGRMTNNENNHYSASFRTYSINVPDYGKIRDIKVWVEWVSDIEPSPVAASLRLDPAETFIGIRSPNVKFEHGYPVLNDVQLSRRGKYKLTGDGTSLPLTGAVKPQYYNTFVLWDAPGGGSSNEYKVWVQSKHMRTVFSDSAAQFNPSHQDVLFGDTGVSNHNHALRNIGSPFWFWSGQSSAGIPLGVNNPKLTWYSEARILSASDPTAAAGSPPVGWLNGPGGTNAENEFDTTGSNYGPEYIKPMYPMLDNIIETRQSATSSIQNFIGFRPGLRGTEVHGEWEIVFGQNDDDAVFGEFGYGAYFRQFRLEFLLEQNEDISFGTLQNNKFKFNKNNVSEVDVGNRKLINRTSGSVYGEVNPERDAEFLNFIYEANSYNLYGKSLGITDLTSSIDFAVFTQLTGAIITKTSASNPSWYLSNEFGTPFIPESSSSYGDNDIVTSFDNTDVIDRVLSPSTLINPRVDLQTILKNTKPTQKASDAIKEILEEDN